MTVLANSKDIDFFYLGREEFYEGVKRVGHVCDDVLADCVILVMLQSAVISGFSKEQATTVGFLYYEEDGVPLYSQDHLWMDLSQMKADLSRGWESINNIYHKECVLKYMDYLKHPRAVPYMIKVSYRKLFVLAVSLSQGFSTAIQSTAATQNERIGPNKMAAAISHSHATDTPHAGSFYSIRRPCHTFFEGWYLRLILPTSNNSYALMFSVDAPGLGTVQLLTPDDALHKHEIPARNGRFLVEKLRDLHINKRNILK